jgi:PAS domain S-box-containing protein
MRGELVQEVERTGGEQAGGSAADSVSARERHLLTQYAVTRVLAEAAGLDEARPAILQAIAENLDWDVGDFWQLDPAAQVLRCVESWARPARALEGFVVASRARLFAPGIGLPGRVWSQRRSHWVVDVAHDANFPRAHEATAAGLQSAFAFPIRLGEDIFGVMEFFSRQAREPDSAALSVFDALSSQIGQFIERKQIEDELHKSRDQLAVILRGVADGITVTQPDGGIIYANAAALHTLGYPSIEALRATPVAEIFARYDILDEAGRPFPLPRLPSRLAHEGVENPSALVRFRVKATGEDYWSILRSSIIRDDQGQVQFAVNIFHDVTDHHRAEEARRVSEERLRLALDAAAMGTWDWNLQTGQLAWTDRQEALFGLAPGQFGGSFAAFLALVHPADQAMVTDEANRAAREHGTFEQEVRAVWPDGTVHWIASRGQYLYDEAGEAVRMLGTSMDTTMRRRAADMERLLAEASILLASSLDYETTLARVARLALPQLADWCYVDIREADDSIRRVAAAHADPAKDALVRQLLDYPPDPAGEHTVVQVLRTGQAAILSDVTDEHTVSNTRNAEHLRVVRALGGIRSFMTVPLTARGHTLGAITFLSSTAARRYRAADLTQAEDLARRAALAVDNARLYREAQDAIQTRDEFMSVAAHELKTPITSLRGYAQLVLRQLDRDGVLDPVRVKRALEVIDQQSDKLANLVSQLLDVSRIEAGRLVLDRQVVDVSSLVENVVTAAQASTTKHTLTMRSPIWVRALVDPLRLEQVMTNLVGNAIKYSPRGGGIDIQIDVARPDTLRITVTDQGIGIAPEHRAYIFDRFYQAHGPGHFGGMGLGLYISRQIVELHHGRIEAEFPSEGGTRFVVTLPTGLNAGGAPEDGWQPA